jgi:hypothetical protein
VIAVTDRELGRLVPALNEAEARSDGPQALDSGDEDNLIQVAMLSGAISSAVMHPLVGDIDDDTLRAKLTEFSRRLIELRFD